MIIAKGVHSSKLARGSEQLSSAGRIKVDVITQYIYDAFSVLY